MFVIYDSNSLFVIYVRKSLFAIYARNCVDFIRMDFEANPKTLTFTIFTTHHQPGHLSIHIDRIAFPMLRKDYI